ncbi:DNA cytosine methyltransferase [Clostridium botulinum C]|uniref:DNA (cytosine-5-)-methyltransferase n=2 Tax=Clostridium botulinum TaxID=1491 RepID=A0A9Q4Y110_CLOBO|nr:DNA (cytosine-5-)-methyltransferase [Clostridium botulinum]YP_398474.1 DNA methyltransferase [Clostridium phage c-st]MCD3196068.1 DNA cytosine methyltransferase [Clostridium botulinum C]MCD3200359.1 DNA cytosine methyltransferase [Clostridium botulinum C]MCD3206892.1 DNA cytosine methyltransferase [Clostridium botulinum C]MCD3207591.1 DNA cytosine methyltransferase [Clostridium botulinum C]MCD3216891.1 DNA cytosine methyltransferase [Clostridium botulinum C]
MKFIDFFSGAGMFRKGMEDAGHECIGYVEIQKQARETYETNYDTTKEWTFHDVAQLKAEDIPNADIWCFGFPCKNMSTANVTTRTGLKGEQSGLFLIMCDLLNKMKRKPQILFIENVQGFSTINGGSDFLEALVRLHKLGYDIKYEISSAMQYDVPQNRIRTYLICKLNNYIKINEGIEIPNKKTIHINKLNIYDLYNYISKENNKFKIKYGVNGEIRNGVCTVLKEKRENDYNLTYLLKDILEQEVEDKYYLTEEQLIKVKKMKGAKQKTLKDGRIWKEGAVPFPDSIDKNARCITPSDGSLNRSTHIIFDGKGYRKLTIRERARLQGLPDDFTFPVSNSQASLQLGNGVVVKVIKEIANKEINLNISK